MEFLAVRNRNRRAAAELQRKETLTLHRVLRDTSDPFRDPRFKAMYRLTPDMVLSLVQELRPYFPETRTSAAVTLEIKVLAALHFYAQGSYQKPGGQDSRISLSQASVSRAIQQTTMALNTPTILCKWIKFPCEVNERQQAIEKNYRRFGIPGVLGYIDGTHVLIQKPTVHEDLDVNRKGQHSLNVQMVCDSNLNILNIVAKYPGSTHDSFVWRSSLVRDKMVQLADSSCWLLGDSGYPLEPWLLTPILNAEPNSPEANYTELHIRSRNCIERCFGVLKARFRCLHKHRVLEYSPTKAGCIANACAVLHNMCIRAGMEEPEELDLNEPIQFDVDARTQIQDRLLYERGLRVRANLINRMF